jgi:hypothetical protein
MVRDNHGYFLRGKQYFSAFPWGTGRIGVYHSLWISYYVGWQALCPLFGRKMMKLSEKNPDADN